MQKGDIHVHYMPTKDMIANGLTKALSKQEHQKFLKQIGVENIDSFLTPDQKNIENPDIEELLFQKQHTQEYMRLSLALQVELSTAEGVY